MKDGKFEGRDFLYFNKKVDPGTKDSLDCIADIANDLQSQHVANQPMVYFCLDGNKVFKLDTVCQQHHTHYARLINLVPISEAE